MQALSELLKQKKITASSGTRPLNLTWERASEFGLYCNLPTTFIMRCFKIYGQDKVLGLRSYMKDLTAKNARATLIWKLKNGL